MRASTRRNIERDLNLLFQTADLQRQWVSQEKYFFVIGKRPGWGNQTHAFIAPMTEAEEKQFFATPYLFGKLGIRECSKCAYRCGSRSGDSSLHLALYQDYQVLPDYASYLAALPGNPAGNNGNPS